MKTNTQTNFEVHLRSKCKESYDDVVIWLRKEGCHDFDWRIAEQNDGPDFILSIYSCGATNLAKIAALLGDFDKQELMLLQK